MTLTVDVPDGLQKEIDSEVERGRYQNKSELVRDAIRRLLEEREKASKEEISEEYAREIKRRIKEVEEGDIGLDDMRTMDEIAEDEGLRE
ncbi:MAG: ribbon-helix-helix domain-containing protein [Candidatus Nanohalobium sp.]